MRVKSHTYLLIAFLLSCMDVCYQLTIVNSPTYMNIAACMYALLLVSKVDSTLLSVVVVVVVGGIVVPVMGPLEMIEPYPGLLKHWPINIVYYM